MHAHAREQSFKLEVCTTSVSGVTYQETFPCYDPVGQNYI